MPLSASDKLVLEQIDNTFSWAVAPKYLENYERLRISTKALAQLILEMSEESRERAKALSHLEEVAMWVNAAIASKQSKHTEE